MTDARRKRLYTLLAVANRELSEHRSGWSDDDYRSILAQCGAKPVDGKPSATTMSVLQMEKAMGRFRALGFKVRRSATGWRAGRIRKCTALWNALADGGHVRDPSARAMQKFLRRQVKGMDALQWATTEQLNQCVEILKQWAYRCKVKLDG